MELEGKSILLRPTTMEDLPLCQKWAADAEVMHHVLRRTFTAEEERTWLEGVLKDPNERLFTIVLRETGESIGTCGVHVKPGEAFAPGMSLGIMIGEMQHWGKGYGAEVLHLLATFASQELHAPKVWLTVDTDHERGRRAYEKAGFHVTRTVTKTVDAVSREQYLMEWHPQAS